MVDNVAVGRWSILEMLQGRDRRTTHLGDGLLDLDDLASASATELAGRGLLAATLRSEDGRGTDNGGCYREWIRVGAEGRDVMQSVKLFSAARMRMTAVPTATSAN